MLKDGRVHTAQFFRHVPAALQLKPQTTCSSCLSRAVSSCGVFPYTLKGECSQLQASETSASPASFSLSASSSLTFCFFFPPFFFSASASWPATMVFQAIVSSMAFFRTCSSWLPRSALTTLPPAFTTKSMVTSEEAMKMSRTLHNLSLSSA
jgi:hypothetical protein